MRFGSALWLLAIVPACARAGGDPTDEPTRGAPGATLASASTLPAWFGSRSQAPRAIAGRVWAGDAALPGATVHLRLAAADPTVWAGLERATAADGTFAFAPLRAGDYVLVATAPHATSRAVAISTLDGAVADLALYTYPCTPIARAVTAHGRPLAGARVDVAGVEVATTDARGRFEVCVGDEPLAATVRAPGYAATALELDRRAAPRELALAVAGDVIGDVLEKNGKPASGVAVRAVAANVPDAPAFPIQATTDALGRFTLRGIARGTRVTFQIVDGTACLDERTTVGLAGDDGDPVHAKLAYASLVVTHPPTAATLRGRAVARDGSALGDARVAFADLVTRTQPDGTFALALDRAARERALADPRARVLAIDHPAGFATARALAPDVLEPERDAAALVIELGATGTIAGTVADAAGHPLAGTVHLVARDTAVDRTVVVGQGGHFALPGVELGQTYDLTAVDRARRAAIEITLDDTMPNVTGLELTLR